MTRVKVAWAASALIFVAGIAWGDYVGDQSDAGDMKGDFGILGWGLLVTSLIALVVSFVLTSKEMGRK